MAVLVFLATAIALAGSGAAAASLRVEATGQTRASWIDAGRPEVRDPALTDLLKRRTNAVLAKDKAAFLADVDRRDEAFAKRQETVYTNLVKLPFGQLSHDLEASKEYQSQVPTGLRQRYGGMVRAAGVTIRYSIGEIDSKPASAPWVPIFGYAEGKWLLVGEVSDKDLPGGTNGQAWDGGAIATSRSRRVLVVVSADDADRGPVLANWAEQALDQVARVRPSGWDGKVLLTAVQDQKIFDSYFADSPDRVRRVAAIAVPYYDRVPEWYRQDVKFATTRVVFNPKQLLASQSTLQHDLVHEFTHAAMGPVTTGYTPRWLVEGFAEYVSYRGRQVRQSDLREALTRLETASGLKDGGSFYEDGVNYVGAWLACQMIVEQFGGEAKLITLYEQFQSVSNTDKALSTVLGVDGNALNERWRAYVRQKKGQ
jgi:hypothetical protein